MKARIYSSDGTTYETIDVPDSVLRNYKKRGVNVMEPLLVVPGLDAHVMAFMEVRKGHGTLRDFIVPHRLFDVYGVSHGSRSAIEAKVDLIRMIDNHYRDIGFVFRNGAWWKPS